MSGSPKIVQVENHLKVLGSPLEAPVEAAGNHLESPWKPLEFWKLAWNPKVPEKHPLNFFLFHPRAFQGLSQVSKPCLTPQGFPRFRAVPYPPRPPEACQGLQNSWLLSDLSSWPLPGLFLASRLFLLFPCLLVSSSWPLPGL